MMLRAVVYGLADGLGRRIVRCDPDLLLAQLGEGEGIHVGDDFDPATQRMDGTEVAPLPAMPGTPDKSAIAADGVDVCTISGLPNPCAVEVTGPATNLVALIEDGSLELSVGGPGRYTVLLIAPGFQPGQVVIDAT